MPGFERTPRPSGPVVQGYGASGFSVDGEIYQAVLLTPQRARAWEAPALNELEIEHVAAALALQPPPEFLILGTGGRQVFPRGALVKALDERGIGIEVMDSRAAARTWGVLRAEERWIAAALMPLQLPLPLAGED